MGRHAVRVSLVIVQAMFSRAQSWGWVTSNPAKAVQKPSSKRERAVVCLEPVRIEAIRDELLAAGSYAAVIISLVAYAALRFPEEALALEWAHVRDRTLLVEQRLIGGEIVPGQKVRHFRPRAVDLIGPLKQDLAEYRLAIGRPLSGLLFPRRDAAPWRITDVNNWRRRVWHPARERAGVEQLPPYHLRHAYASLQIRAGTSIPELAEQMGHSPQMTLSTYAHVMRELKGQPALSAESQVHAARARGPQVALFAENDL